MPQVFQVLKCYKCSIFQVHQTKKDNKWKCKVCGEKQSVKRHYGVGTAKDCRIHVQKLNNLLGDIEELKFKAIDSEDSDYEDKIEKKTASVDKIKINNTQIFSDNAEKESKWLAYVEKEEISVVKDPEYIDNIEVCLELPQKRKINKKSKPFKVLKVSNECNKKTEIINEIIKKLPTTNTNELNTFNNKDNSTNFNYERSVRCQLELNKEKKEVINKSINQPNKDSKWAQYIADENIETDDQSTIIDNDQNPIEYYDDNDRTKNGENNYYQEEKCYQEHNIMDDIENRSNYKETEAHYKPVTSKPIFSLCDENDLDNILDF